MDCSQLKVFKDLDQAYCSKLIPSSEHITYTVHYYAAVHNGPEVLPSEETKQYQDHGPGRGSGSHS